MKKLIASVLTLACILTLVRCGKSDSGDYPATIMVMVLTTIPLIMLFLLKWTRVLFNILLLMQKTAYLKKMAKPISTEI